MRVLMLPHYSEPLRVLKRHADAARARGHAVSIVNVCRLAGDRARVEGLLGEWDEAARFVPADVLEPGGVGLRDLGVAGGFVHPAWRLRVMSAAARAGLRGAARRLLDGERPDVVVLANEHMPYLAEVIEACGERGVGTVCFQWTIANSSVRHTREMYGRMPGRDGAGPEGKPLVREPRGAVGRMMSRAAGVRVGGLMRGYGEEIGFPTPYYGGGRSDRLAVIGEGSRAVYRELGVDDGKMRVVGYPVYEDMVKACGPEPRVWRDRATVLWCTNDQETYWRYDHDAGAMRSAWRSVCGAVAEELPGARLVIKPHPKEDAGVYRSVASGFDGVDVVEGGDVVGMIDGADLVMTRFSSTGVTAVCGGVPTVTMNFPKVPGGTLFEDMGGTMHCNSEAELRGVLRGLRVDARGVIGAWWARRRAFVERYVSVERGRGAADRLVDVMEEVAGVVGRADAA